MDSNEIIVEPEINDETSWPLSSSQLYNILGTLVKHTHFSITVLQVNSFMGVFTKRCVLHLTQDNFNFS